MIKENLSTTSSPSIRKERGFSLLELLIAMTVTLVILTGASRLLAGAFNVRARENRKTDGLSDAQRALNIMSREIANTGFNLTITPSQNGIVPEDSITDENGNQTIRFRANLNKYDTTPWPCVPPPVPPAICVSDTARNGIGIAEEDAGEDIKYFINVAESGKTWYLVRYDPYGRVDAAAGIDKTKTTLANRVDGLHIHYYDRPVTYATGTLDIDITTVRDAAGNAVVEVAPNAARYIVLALAVNLPAVGTPQSSGYQPPSRVLLTSDVMLRNAELGGY
jgi:prepilin-type N-terminal cleavage/methylation domain-containing protein